MDIIIHTKIYLKNLEFNIPFQNDRKYGIDPNFVSGNWSNEMCTLSE